MHKMLKICVCLGLFTMVIGCGTTSRIVLNPQFKDTVLPTTQNYKQVLTPLKSFAIPKRYFRSADGGISQDGDQIQDLEWNDSHWMAKGSFVWWINETEVLMQINPSHYVLVNVATNEQTLMNVQQLAKQPELQAIVRKTYHTIKNITDFDEFSETCADYFEDTTVRLANKSGDKALILRQHQTYKGKSATRLVNEPLKLEQVEQDYCTTSGWLSRHCYVSEVLNGESNKPEINVDEIPMTEVPCPEKGGFLMPGNEYNLSNGSLSSDGRLIIGEKWQYDLTTKTQSPLEKGWVAKMQEGSGISLTPVLRIKVALQDATNERAFMIFTLVNHPDDNYYYGVFNLK